MSPDSNPIKSPLEGSLNDVFQNYAGDGFTLDDGLDFQATVSAELDNAITYDAEKDQHRDYWKIERDRLAYNYDLGMPSPAGQTSSHTLLDEYQSRFTQWRLQDEAIDRYYADEHDFIRETGTTLSNVFESEVALSDEFAPDIQEETALTSSITEDFTQASYDVVEDYSADFETYSDDGYDLDTGLSDASSSLGHSR